MVQYIKKVLNRFLKRPKPISSLEELIFKGLRVGTNFHMQGGCIIDPSHCWHISIGDNVTLAPRVHILAHDASTKKIFNYVKIGKVRLGDNVFVGAGSIILPGVYIGDNVIIGAGSVVTSDIPSNSLAVGSPAKIIDSCSNFIQKRKNELDEFPCFGEEYTVRGNPTNEMKDQMNNLMVARYGYII